MDTAAAHPVRVMLAEDSDIIRDRLVEMLREAAHVDLVGIACDAPEAMALFHAVRPEAIILDIQMPGGNGVDVLQTIRHSDRTCTVIMLTSYNSDYLRQRCLDRGADFFLDKATEFEQVLDVLGEMARRHP